MKLLSGNTLLTKLKNKKDIVFNLSSTTKKSNSSNNVKISKSLSNNNNTFNMNNTKSSNFANTMTLTLTSSQMKSEILTTEENKKNESENFNSFSPFSTQMVYPYDLGIGKNLVTGSSIQNHYKQIRLKNPKFEIDDINTTEGSLNKINEMVLLIKLSIEINDKKIKIELDNESLSKNLIDIIKILKTSNDITDIVQNEYFISNAINLIKCLLFRLPKYKGKYF